MDDFLEQIVTRRRRALCGVGYYALWVAAVLCAVGGLWNLVNMVSFASQGGLRFDLMALILAIALLGAAFACWRATFYLRVEYDYTFTNGVLDVARVLNGKRRVNLASLEMRSLRAAGDEDSKAFHACARDGAVRTHRWYLNGENRRSFFLFEKNGVRHLALLELNDEMKRMIFSRRYMAADIWDGAYKSL